jgi:hypothetical protein
MTDVEAHETVREALSDGLNNSNFYVSLNVTVNDAGANADALDFDDLVRRTNQWLDGLDPDGPASDRENLNTEYGPVTASRPPRGSRSSPSCDHPVDGLRHLPQ